MLFLADVERIQTRIAEASRQVSSGKRIASAADAPDEIEPLLEIRAAQTRNDQIQSNLGLAKNEADSADAALTTAIKIMDRARTLAAQAATSTQDAAGRAAIAGEIDSLQQQMAACASTTVQGRYIFSGDEDGGPAYQFDSAAPNGVRTLSAADATARVEHPAGGSFPAKMAAKDIFDRHNADGSTASDNVFAALNGLRLALLGNDMDRVQASISSIKTASDTLNASQAFYGTVQGRIQDAKSFAASYGIRLKSELSQTEDADAASAAIELAQANAQLQAAFQMRAKLPNQTLFDYLG